MPEHWPVSETFQVCKPKILKIKREQNISFTEARKQYEQFYDAVKPSTCNKSTQTEEKGTKTDNSITNYTKQSVVPKETSKEKSDKITSLLVQGQRLSQQAWKW